MSKSSSSLRSVFVLVALASLAACGDDDTTPLATDAGIEVDLGDVDAGSLACAPPSTSVVPTSPYGTQVGRKFRPLTLNTCAGEPYSIYTETNQDYCTARFTILSIAAGWCGPCRLETSQFAELNATYEPQGVRLVQVMFQDESYGPASNAYCQAWVNEYGLTNVELNDPTQATQIYFPAGSLPATLIIDSTGTIVFREYGTSDGLVSLRAKLDELIAGP